MTPRALGIVVLAVILLGAGWMLWRRGEAASPASPVGSPGGEPPPAMQAATSAAATLPRVEATATAAPNLELLDGEVVDPARSLPGVVRGRLAWQTTGLPIAGAAVQVVRAWPDTVLVNDVERQGQDQVPLRRRELFLGEPATTDRFGRFALEVPEIDGPLALLALRGGQSIEVRPLQPGPTANQTIELGDWLLQPRGEVRGTVVDAQGRPVHRARVRLIDVPLEGGVAFHPLARAARLYGARDFEPQCLLPDGGGARSLSAGLVARDELLPFPEAETDAAGRFVLADARPGASTLVVQAKTALNLAEQVVVQSDEITDVGVLRLGEGDVRGRLLDASGHPVVGAEVSLGGPKSEALLPPVLTGAGGVFESRKLRELPIAAHARCSTAEPWQSCGVEVREGAVVLRLPAWNEMTVDVRGPEGRLRGCRVEVRYGRVFGKGFDLAMPLPEVGPGTYAAAVPGGGGLLVVRADGYAPYVEAAQGRVTVTLSLTTCAARFLVRTRDGRQVARAKVYARVFSDVDPRRRDNPPGRAWAALRPGHVELGDTDERGVLQVDGMWPSMVEVIACHRRLGVAERTLQITAGGPDHELVLGERTRGRLVGLLTENRLPPRDRWLVVAERAEPPALRRTTLAEKDGTFAFGSLTSGLWQIGITVRAGPPEAAWMLPWTPSTADIVLREPQRVTVVAGQEQHIGIEIGRGEGGRPAHAGKVRIDGAPAPGLSVRVYEAEDQDVVALRQRVSALESELQAGTLSARARKSASSELVIRKLHLRRHSSAESPEAIAVTDDCGAFAFARARGKCIDVVASVAGLQQTLWSGTHADGAPIDIRTGSALVEVQGQDGQRMAHRMFAIDGQGDIAGVRLRAVADRFGILRLTGIPCGSYALRSLSQGSVPLSFAAPAFSITGPNWARSTVAAR